MDVQPINELSHHNHTPQEGNLAAAMLKKDPHGIVKYKMQTNGTREVADIGGIEFEELVTKFRSDPKEYMGIARSNVLSIMQDTSLSLEKRQERVKRYVNAHLQLIVKLDRSAFKPTAPGEVRRGIPDYIPDGFSDMGSNDVVDPQMRSREKIRVDKEAIFKKANTLFYDIFSMGIVDPSSTQAKEYIVKRVAHYVYHNMPYDYKNLGLRSPFGKSINASDFMDDTAVCRHHALVTQVLLQAFGISSRLAKVDVDYGNGVKGAHANNVVRINNTWYMLDTTSPDNLPDETRQIFLKKVPDRNIDLNKQKYQWQFTESNAKNTRVYKTRNDLYYRIMDNVNNPVN